MLFIYFEFEMRNVRQTYVEEVEEKKGTEVMLS